MVITKLEHSSFVVESNGYRLAVDIGNRVSDQSFALMGIVSAVLVSHIHPDHFVIDRLNAMAAPVYTVAQVAELLTETQLKVSVSAIGQTVKIEGTPFTITFTESDHGPNVTFPVENAGFIISVGRKSLWYLGDMFVPLENTPQESYDVLMIPVGGKGYTFGPEEAVAYVERLGWSGVTIPVHYHMWPDGEPAHEVADQLKGKVDVRILDVGERVEI